MESWKDTASGETIETYTIITCPPNRVAADIHNRMPVIVDPADFGRWLNASDPAADLLRPYPANDITAYPVSTAVNTPKNDRPELIESVSH